MGFMIGKSVYSQANFCFFVKIWFDGLRGLQSRSTQLEGPSCLLENQQASVSCLMGKTHQVPGNSHAWDLQMRKKHLSDELIWWSNTSTNKDKSPNKPPINSWGSLMRHLLYICMGGFTLIVGYIFHQNSPIIFKQ